MTNDNFESTTDNDTTRTTETTGGDTLRPWWTRSWIGLAACVLPAVLLAACSLGSEDDEASIGGTDDAAVADTRVGPQTDTSATIAPDTAPDTVATEPPETVAADSTLAVDETSTTVEPAPTPSDPDADAISPVSFATSIEPIITRTCASCHTGDGPGTQHVIMDTAGVVAKASVGIEFVTRTGFMPPWPASDESVDFEHDWSLSDDEVALLASWHEAGAPLDVAEDHVIAPATGETVRLNDPDLEIKSQGSYDGELGQEDEYRCMVYDPEFDGAGFVTGIDFIPDQEQVVHHAVGFVLSGNDRATIEELDGNDGNDGGWTCFGFSPASSAELVYVWAPGQAASRYPEGSGLLLDDGDFFVMQTHYHYDVEAPADQSTLALDWTSIDDADGIDPINISVFLGPAEVPCNANESGPLCDRAAAIDLARQKYGPAGVLADVILAGCGQTPEDYAGFTDGYAESSCDQRARTRGELVSVFGHQHEVGSTFRLTLNPGTPEELVVLDIPNWDFNWQLNYEPVDTIIIEPDDVIRMECSWDRARRDPALDPAYIVWADGTDDEMCFASIVTRPV